MNGARLQTLIYRGYQKAALRIGTDFDVYRSTSAIDPLLSTNLITSLLASANISWSYEKANRHGNAVWQLIADGRLLQCSDYLVGESTFFIAGMQPLLPILAVKCNRTLTIKRPTQPTGIGAVGYGGYLDATAKVIMQNCPAALLESGKSETNTVQLPTDAKVSWYRVLLPALANVILKTGDIITDEASLQYMTNSAELTELGWRLSVNTLGA